MEERDDIISLVDDEGNEVEFEFVTNIEHNGNEYFILMPLEDETDENGEESLTQVLILKVEKNEGSEESLVTVEEEEEKAVFEEFKKIMDEEFEFEE